MKNSRGKREEGRGKAIFFLFFFLPSSFFLPPAAQATEGPYAHTYEMSKAVNEKLSRNISLDLRKIDVVDVLKFLSTKADLNVVTSQNVNAKVTLFLKDVSISNALDIILISSGLALREKEGVLYVMTEEEYAALYGESYRDQRHVKIVQIRYTNPTQLAEALGSVKSNVGKVIIDKPTGTVVLIDTEEKVGLMEKIIDKLDIPTVERILPTQTQVFELSYNKVTTLEGQAKLLLTEGVGKIQSDEKTNQMVVTDFPHVLRNIKTLMDAFDRKTRQVFIETKMIQIRLNNNYQMGIDWQQIINQGPERQNFTLDNNINFSATGTAATRNGTIVFGDIGRRDVQGTIQFLHEFGDTQTLAAPQITVEHNKEASITVGTHEAYVTSTVSQADSSTTNSESITFIDVGVQLKVTPFINKEGFISMQIKPEISSVGRTLTTANTNLIPIVDTTNAATQVTVKDGHTVLIGGLMKDEISKTVQKVPMLGEIPFIGSAFRSTSDSKVKTELVIFLTPHIVQGNEISPYNQSSAAARKTFDNPRNFNDIKKELESKITKLRAREASSSE